MLEWKELAVEEFAPVAWEYMRARDTSLGRTNPWNDLSPKEQSDWIATVRFGLENSFSRDAMMRDLYTLAKAVQFERDARRRLKDVEANAQREGHRHGEYSPEWYVCRRNVVAASLILDNARARVDELAKKVLG